jgi:hypothetical protein
MRAFPLGRWLQVQHALMAGNEGSAADGRDHTAVTVSTDLWHRIRQLQALGCVLAVKAPVVGAGTWKCTLLRGDAVRLAADMGIPLDKYLWQAE